MAIANADGSIVLSTIVDQSGIKSFGSSLKKLAGSLAAAFSINQIVKFSNAAGQLATQTEASVQRLVDIYGSASDSVGDFIDANARALGMSKAAAASFSSVYGNLFSVWADQATNAELTNRYLNMTAVVASKTGRTVEDVQERVRSGLLGNTEAIEDLGIFVNVKTIEMTDAFQRMAGGKSWEQLDAYTQQQIRSMAILEQATAKYGDEVADTSATVRNKFNAAYEDFKNTWGQFINTVLLPILEVLTQVFDIATKGMNALMGKSGKTLENVELQEENTQKTAKNIEEQTEAQEELNKESKKTLAGFDEIQILSSETNSNIEETGEGEKKPPIETPITPPETDEDTQGKVNEKLAAIISGVGLLLAALGIILLCFGQIGWGIGLLIAGIAIFSVSRASLSNETEDKTKEKLDAIVAIASAALLALGIILLFTPASLPLAIGLIIAGAAGLATEAALNWDAVWSKAKEIFNTIIDWIKTYGLLVLGITLCLTGVGMPFGLALIIKWAKDGAEKGVPLATTIVDKVKEIWGKVKNFWDTHIAKVFTGAFWLNLAKKCGNGLIGGFENAINGIIGMFENMINWIVNGLNKISFDVPDWVPGIGGKTFGFDMSEVSFGRVSIPRLAKGAVIPPNREFLAVLGDNKRENEIVSPVSAMKQAFTEAMIEMGGYNGRGNTEVVLEIDGREFGRAVVEQGNRENRRIGTRLVIA